MELGFFPPMWVFIFKGLSLKCIIKSQESVAVVTGPFEAKRIVSQARLIN